MDDDRRWVLLCECWNVAELHTLRASLEAHGLPVQIQGEQTQGVMGMLQGASVKSRILVPRAGLAQARMLAEEVLGPFDETMEAEDEREGSPFRRPAHALARHEEVRPAPLPRRKSIVVILVVQVVSWLMFPMFGLGHVYVGRSVEGGAIILAAIFAYAAGFGGAWWTFLLLLALSITDLVGGVLGVLAHNRALDADARARDEEEDDREEDDREEDEDDEDEGEDGEDAEDDLRE